jgi:hypothetical protein
LGTKEILLDAKGDLFGSYEDRMGVTVDELVIEEPRAFGDVLP